MMLVKTCCGCISLQKGVIVIGTLSMISAILNAIMMGSHISEMASLSREDSINSSQVMLLKSFVVTLLIYILIGGVFSGLIIVGSFKRVSGYFFPWLALGFAGLIAVVATILALIIVTSSILPLGGFFAIILFLIAAAALQIHLWLVVYSHYKEVVAEKYGHQTRPNDGDILNNPTKNPYHNV